MSVKRNMILESLKHIPEFNTEPSDNTFVRAFGKLIWCIFFWFISHTAFFDPHWCNGNTGSLWCFMFYIWYSVIKFWTCVFIFCIVFPLVIACGIDLKHYLFKKDK